MYYVGMTFLCGINGGLLHWGEATGLLQQACDTHRCTWCPVVVVLNMLQIYSLCAQLQLNKLHVCTVVRLNTVCM